MTEQEIVNIIKNDVAIFNARRKTITQEFRERFKNELIRLLNRLNKISSKKEFICYYSGIEDCYEFGFYDEFGKWVVIEK